MSDVKVTIQPADYSKYSVTGEEMREHLHQQWKRLDCLYRIDARGHFLVSTYNARYAHIASTLVRNQHGHVRVLCKSAKMTPYFKRSGESEDLEGKDICHKCLQRWNPGMLNV